MSFRERLTLVFQKKFGITAQKEIAEKLDVSGSAMTKYANGSYPEASILFEIEKLTNSNLHWLLTGKGSMRVISDEDVPEFDEEATKIIKKMAEESGNTFAEQVEELALSNLVMRGLLSVRPSRKEK